MERNPPPKPFIYYLGQWDLFEGAEKVGERESKKNLHIFIWTGSPVLRHESLCDYGVVCVRNSSLAWGLHVCFLLKFPLRLFASEKHVIS